VCVCSRIHVAACICIVDQRHYCLESSQQQFSPEYYYYDVHQSCVTKVAVVCL
jgi:hypothetical protein